LPANSCHVPVVPNWCRMTLSLASRTTVGVLLPAVSWNRTSPPSARLKALK